jgi:decaprenyl-phosphate phosphoribosyltransferase
VVAAPAPPSLSPLRILLGLVWTVRPHQWVKNAFVIAPIAFAREIFDPWLLLTAGGAFAVFCVFAGAVYTINDLVDAEADRQHPVKRHRPIASGAVPPAFARVFAVMLIVGGTAGALLYPLPFALTAVGYFLMNVAYSLRLKKVPYLDVGIIALGFVLRVLAGGFATRIDVSGYLFACTALLALFLGFGKRRHELVSAEASKQRAVLEAYSKRGLDIALGVTATATVATYVAYTLDSTTRAYFQSDYLWVSTALVVSGVMRFLYLVRNRPEAESPTQEMLKDGPMVGIVLIWVMTVMWMVYHLEPSPLP